MAKLGTTWSSCEGSERIQDCRASMTKAEFDIRTKQAEQPEFGLGQGHMQVDGAELDDLFAAEGQQLLGDRSGLFRDALDLVEVRVRRRFFG